MDCTVDRVSPAGVAVTAANDLSRRTRGGEAMEAFTYYPCSTGLASPLLSLAAAGHPLPAPCVPCPIPLLRSTNSFYTSRTTLARPRGSSPLTCVGSQVRLQVAALPVHLGAPRLPAPVALRSLRTSTRAPQLALRREPGRRRGRALRSGDHLLAHPGQVCQDARDHEHGGTGRGGGGLLAH